MPIAVLYRQSEHKTFKFGVESYIGELTEATKNSNALSDSSEYGVRNAIALNHTSGINGYIGELTEPEVVKNYIGSLLRQEKTGNSISENVFIRSRTSLSVDSPINYTDSALFACIVFVEKQQEGVKEFIKNGFVTAGENIYKSGLNGNADLSVLASLANNFKDNGRTTLGLCRESQNINEIKEAKTAEFLIKNGIVDLETYKKSIFGNAFGLEAGTNIKNNIANGLHEDVKIKGAIDSYKGEKSVIINSISESGIAKDIKVRNAIESFGILLQQGMDVEIDSINITGSVKSGSITLIGDGIYSNATVEIATDKPIFGETLAINIDGKEYRFVIEESDFDIKEHRQSVWGRPETARLYEPYALKQDYAFKNRTAKDVALSVAAGFDVDWQIEDWFIPAYRKEKAYPMDVIKEIAEAGGGVVRCLPDGKIHIVYPYQENKEANIDLLLSLQMEKQVKQFDGVRIIFGEDDGVIAIADKTVLKPYEWATVKVYSKVPYTIQTNADVYYKAKNRAIERITEEVKCTNGKGEIGRPVLRVIDSGGLDVYGRAILCEGCDVVSVVYETVYDEWKLTKYKESVAIFCSIETENSITLTNGAGSNIKEIKNNIANANSARKIAIRELAKVLGLQKIKIATPYDSGFCDADRIKTGFGDGYTTKNTITFASNPLKILNKMEAVIWRRP